jgi:hypothetical protein
VVSTLPASARSQTTLPFEHPADRTQWRRHTPARRVMHRVHVDVQAIDLRACLRQFGLRLRQFGVRLRQFRLHLRQFRLHLRQFRLHLCQFGLRLRQFGTGP